MLLCCTKTFFSKNTNYRINGSREISNRVFTHSIHIYSMESMTWVLQKHEQSSDVGRIPHKTSKRIWSYLHNVSECTEIYSPPKRKNQINYYSELQKNRNTTGAFL